MTHSLLSGPHFLLPGLWPPQPGGSNFPLTSEGLTVTVESESHSVVSSRLRPHELYSSWNSPGQNTRVGSLSLLQGILPTQESNWSLPHCRRILYQLGYQGATSFCGILQWKFSCSASFKIIWISYALMILCITPSSHPSPGHVGVCSFQTGHITQDCKEKNCLSEGKKSSNSN